ncbi:MAG: arylsulfatase A-like enzyme, partial [Gammaproteobacteria bacterium]
MPKKPDAPNVLFIITDQQRADHNGFMGNTILKTPNLDKLANKGMVFENAWVSNPVCMPNRSTILTGRMPSSHGVTFNDRSLDPNSNTFAKTFRKAGYRTGLIGKSHLQHGVSKNSMIPFRGESSMASPHHEGWDKVEDSERYITGETPNPEDFYGFDRIDLSIDHGAMISGHHYQWALDRGAKKEDILVHQDEDGPSQHRSKNWRQIFQPPYTEDVHSTTFVTERTIAFIDDAAHEQKPWLAWCSFPDPHHPMTPPGKWFHRYKPEDM